MYGYTDPTVTRNTDYGYMEVFMIGSDKQLYLSAKDSNAGEWSSWITAEAHPI
jgi:hypothetical protein